MLCRLLLVCRLLRRLRARVDCRIATRHCNRLCAADIGRLCLQVRYRWFDVESCAVTNRRTVSYVSMLFGCRISGISKIWLCIWICTSFTNPKQWSLVCRCTQVMVWLVSAVWLNNGADWREKCSLMPIILALNVCQQLGMFVTLERD